MIVSENLYDAPYVKEQTDMPLLVRADHRVPYGDVVAGMVLLQRAGAKKVGFITEPPERLSGFDGG